MKLTFLGTRGYIDPRSPLHRRHTSTLVEYEGERVMIDCGLDWAEAVEDVAPEAIVITHPHPDHAFGLRDGAPCPVYAVAEAWEKMDDFAVPGRLRHVLTLRRRRPSAGSPSSRSRSSTPPALPRWATASPPAG